MGLGSWSDNHLEPPEDEIMGYDWEGQELYGNEEGYLIEGEFIMEDDLRSYIKNMFKLVVYEDIL